MVSQPWHQPWEVFEEPQTYSNPWGKGEEGSETIPSPHRGPSGWTGAVWLR